MKRQLSKVINRSLFFILSEVACKYNGFIDTSNFNRLKKRKKIPLTKRHPESRLKRLLSGFLAVIQLLTSRLKAESKGEKATYRGGLSG
jgi:hypothetical protein